MDAINVFDAAVTYDDTDPDGYRCGAATVGPEGRMTTRVYELPPGQTVCPYHYESEEEWLLILDGEVTVRHPDGEDVLRRGDLMAFPPGPDGAHKTTNRGATTARLAFFSTHTANGYAVYPDSDKVGYWTDSGDARDSVRVRRGEGLDYYDGEV